MTNDKIKQLTQGLQTAFIDQAITSNLAYKPQFVSNNYKEGRKVISSIEDELLSCNEFYISVAFITQGGSHLFSRLYANWSSAGFQVKFLQPII